MLEMWIRSFYQFLDKLGFTHPIHVVLVHLPIGFVVGAFIFGFIGSFYKRERLILSARDCIALALFFWLPVVLFGFADWIHYYGGASLFAVRMKVILSGILFMLLVAAAYFGFRSKKASRWLMQTLYASCLTVVIFIGWYGAQLIYGSNPQLVLMPYKSGYQVFMNECASCHPNGNNIIDESKPVSNAPQLQDVNNFISFLRHPSGSMPSYPSSKISDHEAEELYQYVTEAMKK